jgi:hypothetical protein
MEIRFSDLQRLVELWAAWYSIGVDGWLSSDESTHTCSLDLPDLSDGGNNANPQPSYPPDLELDRLFLRALNEIGLQCSRLGSISFSRVCTGADITAAGEPVVALLESGQTFFSGKYLSLFSELRRDYGDFGSHTMALDLTVQDGQVVIHRASLEMNNRRRGIKLELLEPLTNALVAYEEIFEQGAALGHSFTEQHPSDLMDTPEEAMSASEGTADVTIEDAEDAEALEEAEEAHSFPEGSAQRRVASLPFPCLSQAEAAHLARLSSHVAPSRHAVSDGATLLSTHPLRELAMLITFVRFCEPLGVLQRI